MADSQWSSALERVGKDWDERFRRLGHGLQELGCDRLAASERLEALARWAQTADQALAELRGGPASCLGLAAPAEPVAALRFAAPAAPASPAFGAGGPAAPRRTFCKPHSLVGFMSIDLCQLCRESRVWALRFLYFNLSSLAPGSLLQELNFAFLQCLRVQPPGVDKAQVAQIARLHCLRKRWPLDRGGAPEPAMRGPGAGQRQPRSEQDPARQQCIRGITYDLFNDFPEHVKLCQLYLRNEEEIMGLKRCYEGKHLSLDRDVSIPMWHMIYSVVHSGGMQRAWDLCTRYNHTGALGCQAENCPRVHRCSFCYSSEHGAHFGLKQGALQCEGLKAFEKERTEMKELFGLDANRFDDFADLLKIFPQDPLRCPRVNRACATSASGAESESRFCSEASPGQVERLLDSDSPGEAVAQYDANAPQWTASVVSSAGSPQAPAGEGGMPEPPQPAPGLSPGAADAPPPPRPLEAHQEPRGLGQPGRRGPDAGGPGQLEREPEAVERLIESKDRVVAARDASIVELKRYIQGLEQRLRDQSERVAELERLLGREHGRAGKRALLAARPRGGSAECPGGATALGDTGSSASCEALKRAPRRPTYYENACRLNEPRFQRSQNRAAAQDEYGKPFDRPERLPDSFDVEASTTDECPTERAMSWEEWFQPSRTCALRSPSSLAPLANPLGTDQTADDDLLTTALIGAVAPVRAVSKRQCRLWLY
ncbi:unnamed protein product [Prorocentrum cordatum]|uniref:Uncharacterized protein n=1 Tax=Prorocentrum cordatum TaxID=2364126 RepID=A0ABN9SF11_9DINO|nr:unnamed protein product [Polarella glacialis]